MSFIPNAVKPKPLDQLWIEWLQFPQDKRRIARLSLEEKQIWYAKHEPQRLIDMGLENKFANWWFFHYILPLKLKRALYRLKFW